MDNMALLMCGSRVLSFNSVADSVNFDKAPDIAVLLFLACEKWWGMRGKTFCANRKNTDIAKIRAISHSQWQCLKVAVPSLSVPGGMDRMLARPTIMVEISGH